MKLVGRIAESRGFRRRAARTIASWTSRGVDPDLPPPDDPIAAEEWAIFARYRSALRKLNAEDAEGLVHWAAQAIASQGIPDLQNHPGIVVVEPAMTRAVSIALEALKNQADSLLVTLNWSNEPSRAEIFIPASAARERFLEWGFIETAIEPADGIPAGLEAVRNQLFRSNFSTQGRAPAAEGLLVRGAPQGDGESLSVAARVRDLIETGAAPDEILIAFRRLDEQAIRTRDTLIEWGLPVALEAPTPMAIEPAISALRLASSLAAGDWETAKLARLLRNGQLRPAWPEITHSLALSEAAAALVSTRVFRGREPIRAGLQRLAEAGSSGHRDDSRRRRRAERAARSSGIVGRLIEAVEAAAQPGTWSQQLGKLRNFATDLGLGASNRGRLALEHLWLALEDHGGILDGLGLGDEVRPWSRFVAACDRIIKETSIPAADSPPNAVRILADTALSGASCDHLILADLAEGTYPDPDAIARENDGFSREMKRFLTLVGSAESSLTLVYPTTDEAGLDLLPAGFLEAVRDVFQEPAWAAISLETRRIEPSLPAAWAGSPAVARVRAMALACEQAEMSELDKLSKSESHRRALLGTAVALEVARQRGRKRDFGPFDGRLGDPALIERIATEFGPNRPAFSPSQLETLALCPFQFYLRFVLQLEPPEDRGELDDDFIARGNLIHRALESLHLRLRDAPEPGLSLDEAVARGIGPAIAWELEQAGEPAPGVETGLRAVLAARLERTGRLYADQFTHYHDSKPGGRAEPRHFEVIFGGSDADAPPLVIGTGEAAVRLQGSIDRIDVLQTADGEPRFRVIDYKTGPTPPAADLLTGLALQLPLYTLAAERIGLGADSAADFGYWALGDKGFRAAKLPKTINWPAYVDRLEQFVLALAAQLRRAEFPVAPRTEHCMRYCDYSHVCRIKQIRALDKTWADAPKLEPTS